MRSLSASCSRCVRKLTLLSLTLCALLGTSGCSYLNHRFQEDCKTRAYVHTPLAEHLNTRFHSKAPVRMAIIPFSVRANITSLSNELPGLENQLAWKLHAEMLSRGEVPIVELLNRQDWPGKKEEFFTGNFGALELARDAGYDLILVGMLEGFKTTNEMTAYSKIIEVESGITIWYGQTIVTSGRKDRQYLENRLYLDHKRPDLTYTYEMTEEMAACIAREVGDGDDQ